MRVKEIVGLVAIMVIALIVISIIRDKKMNERVSRVENILGNLLINSDQTKLALACMIEEQQAIKAEALPIQNREPIGFKQNQKTEA